MRNGVRLGSAMAGVAGLVVSGMIATPAGALTAVKEKPPLYRYESFWVFPPAHWHDADKDNATANQRVLAPALADGALVGYGDDKNLVYSGEGFTHDNWWQATSRQGVLKLVDVFDERDASGSPQLAGSTEHKSQLYVSRFYNWKAGSWKGAYGYRLAYKLRPGAVPEDAAQMLSSFYVPILESLLADGTIVEYEVDWELVHSDDSPGHIVISFVTPTAEDLDKAFPAFAVSDSEGPLIEAAKASVFTNRDAPHRDWVRVNVTYK